MCLLIIKICLPIAEVGNGRHTCKFCQLPEIDMRRVVHVSVRRACRVHQTPPPSMNSRESRDKHRRSGRPRAKGPLLCPPWTSAGRKQQHKAMGMGPGQRLQPTPGRRGPGAPVRSFLKSRSPPGDTWSCSLPPSRATRRTCSPGPSQRSARHHPSTRRIPRSPSRCPSTSSRTLGCQPSLIT